ncbi:PLP-dependent aspartate aminotransferase family protein [Arthrobacter sp. 24S4-2]|uniref:trans-sulfuration enzyme family protein n=1 Tax=Arthrobacter sp. 24S4-2 TaxID=2575374 RepID=UPI001585DAE6|nr:PLP-dependent aspartate aminotransferase family protein [Arthrobacter sp. 24S4-2]
MLSRDSLAVHAGRNGLTEQGVHAVPIDLSTTAPLPSVHDGGQAYEQMATGGVHLEGQSTVYQRLWNPTVARFEDGVAALEGAPEAVAFATGMAALSAALLATVAAGKKHVVAVRPLYGGSDHILASGVLGTEVTFSSADGVRAALRPDTGLVIVETPANPSLELVDIARLAADADGVPLLVDNTFASPVLQQPLAHGATLVLHSATKFLGGHGDAMGGVIAACPEWTTRLRQVRAVTGGILTPWPAYLLHRGLATLPVRVRAQQATAHKVATALAGHGLVKDVFYPGLPECDPLGLVGTQMSGPGSLMAFELASAEHAERIPPAVRMITHAVSLGGIDTLIQHPAGLTHRPVAAEAKPHARLLRLSVGLEDSADIVADLVQAIEGTR